MSRNPQSLYERFADAPKPLILEMNVLPLDIVHHWRYRHAVDA